MHLLSFFLEGPQGFSHTEVLGENLGKGEVESLHRTVAVARDALKGMLRGLLKGGHFKGRGDMWTATQDMVGQFAQFGEDLRLVLKEAVTSTSPPSVKKE